MSEKDVWIHTVEDPEISLRLYERIRDRGDVKRALVIVEHVDGDKFSVLGQHMPNTQEVIDLLAVAVASVSVGEGGPSPRPCSSEEVVREREESFHGHLAEAFPLFPPPELRTHFRDLYCLGAVAGLERVNRMTTGRDLARKDLITVAEEFHEFSCLSGDEVPD